MAEVLKNLELRTTTMGSLAEFKQMVRFVEDYQIQPIIFKTLSGFKDAAEGFEIIKKGQQFGKVVVKIVDEESESNSRL